MLTSKGQPEGAVAIKACLVFEVFTKFSVLGDL